MQGLFLINKIQGMSSRNVGVELKKRFNLSKVGHVGTLDVEASGLLLILSENCTKLQNYFLDTAKIYEGTILLGVTSLTEDVFSECKKIENADSKLEVFAEDYQALLLKIKAEFSPTYLQMPSLVSAKKVKGISARKLVNQGLMPELNPKQVNLEFLELDFIDKNRLFYRVKVSSGFYVRALARDIGNLLEVGGVAESIKRTQVASFSLSDAISLEELDSSSLIHDGKSFIRQERMANCLGYKTCKLETLEEVIKFKNGNKLILNITPSYFESQLPEYYSVLDPHNNFIGIVSQNETGPKFEVVL